MSKTFGISFDKDYYASIDELKTEIRLLKNIPNIELPRNLSTVTIIKWL
jgi:hypothetical protein